MDAHALVAPGERHPVAVHRDHDRADPLGPLPARPSAPHQHPRSSVTERRVVLVAVEPPGRAVGHQGGPHFLHRRPGVGFGDADGDDGLAVGHGREPAVLQRGPAEVLDAPGRPVVSQLAADGGRDVVAGRPLRGRWPPPRRPYPRPPHFSPMVTRKRSAAASAAMASVGSSPVSSSWAARGAIRGRLPPAPAAARRPGPRPPPTGRRGRRFPVSSRTARCRPHPRSSRTRRAAAEVVGEPELRPPSVTLAI